MESPTAAVATSGAVAAAAETVAVTASPQSATRSILTKSAAKALAMVTSPRGNTPRGPTTPGGASYGGGGGGADARDEMSDPLHTSSQASSKFSFTKAFPLQRPTSPIQAALAAAAASPSSPAPKKVMSLDNGLVFTAPSPITLDKVELQQGREHSVPSNRNARGGNSPSRSLATLEQVQVQTYSPRRPLFASDDEAGSGTVVARAVHDDDDDDDEEREVAMVLGVLPAVHGTTTTPVAHVTSDEHGGTSSTHRAKDAMDQVRKFLRKARAAQKTKKQKRLEGQKEEVMLIPDSASLPSSPRNRLTVNPWSAAKPSIKLISPRRKKAIRALSLSPTSNNMPTSPTSTNDPVSPTSTIATNDQEHLLVADALALATPKTSNTTTTVTDTMPSTPGQVAPLTPEQARAIARKAILTNKRLQEQQRFAKFHQKPPRGNDPPGGFKQLPLRVPVDVDGGSQHSVSDLDSENDPKHPIVEIHAQHPAMSVSTLGNSQPRNLDDDSISTKPEFEYPPRSATTSLPARLTSAQSNSTIIQFEGKDKYLQMEDIKQVELEVTHEVPEIVSMEDDDEQEKRSESLSREMMMMMLTASTATHSREQAEEDGTEETEDGLPPFLLSSCSEMLPAQKTLDFLRTELQEVGELGFELALTSTTDGNGDRQSDQTTSNRLMTVVDSMQQDTSTANTDPANLADDLTSTAGELTDGSLQTDANTLGRDKDTMADSTYAVFFLTEKRPEADDETDVLDSILDGESPAGTGEDAAELLNSLLSSSKSNPEGATDRAPLASETSKTSTKVQLDVDPMHRMLEKVEADVSQANSTTKLSALDELAKCGDETDDVEPADTMTWSEIRQEESTTDRTCSSVNEADPVVQEKVAVVERDASTELSSKLPEPDTWDVVREIAEEAMRGESMPMSPTSNVSTDGVSKSKLEALEDVMVLALARLAGGVVDPTTEGKIKAPPPPSLPQIPERDVVNTPTEPTSPLQLELLVKEPQISPQISKPQPPRPDAGKRRMDSSPVARMRLESAVAARVALGPGYSHPDGNDHSDWFPDESQRESMPVVSPKAEDWSATDDVKGDTPNSDPVEGLRQSWEGSASRTLNELSRHKKTTDASTNDTLEDVLALAEQRLSQGLEASLSKSVQPKPNESTRSAGAEQFDTLEDVMAMAEQKLSRSQGGASNLTPINTSMQFFDDNDRSSPPDRRPDPPPSKPERRSRTEQDPDGWSESEIPVSSPRNVMESSSLKKVHELSSSPFHFRPELATLTSREAGESGDSTSTSHRLKGTSSSSAEYLIKDGRATGPSASSTSNLTSQNTATSVGLNSIKVTSSKRSSDEGMSLRRGEEMEYSMGPKSSKDSRPGGRVSHSNEKSPFEEEAPSKGKTNSGLDSILTEVDSKNASIDTERNSKSTPHRERTKAPVSPKANPYKTSRHHERYALPDNDQPNTSSVAQDWNHSAVSPKSVSNGVSPRLNVSQDDALERIFTFLGLNPDSYPDNRNGEQRGPSKLIDTSKTPMKDLQTSSANENQDKNCNETCANFGSGVFAHENAAQNTNGKEVKSPTSKGAYDRSTKGKSMLSDKKDGHALADDISGAHSEGLLNLLPRHTIAAMKLGPDEGKNRSDVLPPIGETGSQHAAQGIGLMCGLLGLVRGADFNGSGETMKDQSDSLLASNTENQHSTNSRIDTRSGSVSGNESLKFGPEMKLLAPDDEYWDTLSTIASTKAYSTADDGPRVDGPIPQEISMPESPPGEGRSRWFCWQPEARQGKKLEPTLVEEDETSKDSAPTPHVPLEIAYASEESQSKRDSNVVTNTMGKLQTILKDEHEDSSLSQTMAMLSQSQSRSTEGGDTILEDLVNIAARAQNGDHRIKGSSSRSKTPDKARSEPPRKKVANLIEMFKAARSDLNVGTSVDGEADNPKERPGKVVGNLIEKFECPTGEPRTVKKLGTLEEKAIDAIEKLGLATEVDEQTIKVCKDDVDDEDTVPEGADSDKPVKGEKNSKRSGVTSTQVTETKERTSATKSSSQPVIEHPSINDKVQLDAPAIRPESPSVPEFIDDSTETATKNTTKAHGEDVINTCTLISDPVAILSHSPTSFSDQKRANDDPPTDPLLMSRGSTSDQNKETAAVDLANQQIHFKESPPAIVKSEETEAFFSSPDRQKEGLSPRADWAERRHLKIEVGQPDSSAQRTRPEPLQEENPVASPEQEGQVAPSRAERAPVSSKRDTKPSQIEMEPPSPTGEEAHLAKPRLRSPKADKTYLSRSPRNKTHSRSPRSKKFTWDDHDRKMVEKSDPEDNEKLAHSPEGVKLDPDITEARSEESDDARALLLAVTRSGDTNEWSLSGSELSELIEECFSTGSSVVVNEGGKLTVVDRNKLGPLSPRMASTAVTAVTSPTAISEATTATSGVLSAETEPTADKKAISPKVASTDELNIEKPLGSDQSQISQVRSPPTSPRKVKSPARDQPCSPPNPTSPVRSQPTSPQELTTPPQNQPSSPPSKPTPPNSDQPSSPQRPPSPRKKKLTSPRKATKLSEESLTTQSATAKITLTDSGNLEIEPTERVEGKPVAVSVSPARPIPQGDSGNETANDGDEDDAEIEKMFSSPMDRTARALTKEEFIGEMATRRALMRGISKNADNTDDALQDTKTNGKLKTHSNEKGMPKLETMERPIGVVMPTPKEGLSLRERVLSIIVEKQIEQIPAASDDSGSVYIEQSSPLQVSKTPVGVPLSVTIPDAEKSPRNGGSFPRSPKLQIVLDRLKERRRKELENLSKSFEETPSVASLSDISPDSDVSHASPDVEGMLATYDNIVRLVKQNEKPKLAKAPSPKANDKPSMEEQSHASESTEVRLQKAHELWVLGDVTPSGNAPIDLVKVDKKVESLSPRREARNPDQTIVLESLLRAREALSTSPTKSRVVEHSQERVSQNSPPKHDHEKTVFEGQPEKRSWIVPPRQGTSPAKGRILKPLPESPRQSQSKDATRERNHPWNRDVTLRAKPQPGGGNDHRGRDVNRVLLNRTPPRAATSSSPVKGRKSPRALVPESPITIRRTPERRYPSPSPERPISRPLRKGDDARRETLAQPDLSQIAISKSKSSTTEENSWAGSKGTAKARALRAEIDVARKNSDMIRTSQSSLSKELETFKEKVQQTNNVRGERVIAAATAAAEAASRRPAPKDLAKSQQARIPSNARPSRSSGDRQRQEQSRPMAEEKLIEIFDHMDARKREEVQEKLLQRIQVLRKAADERRKTNQKDDECDRQLTKLEQVIKQLHGKSKAVHQ